MRTVELASAPEPLTSGLLSFDGEAGSVAVIVGAPGACESSVYGNAEEQPDTFPAASVAVARRLVVWFAVTVAVIPVAPLNVAAGPEPSGVPVQSEVE